MANRSEIDNSDVLIRCDRCGNFVPYFDIWFNYYTGEKLCSSCFWDLYDRRDP